ncbi:GNAT family N-acetyltransferase [Granulicella sp. S190]|uniref:GNAT family N-acetyltransferase n=1 Tax=Granulicella sp. S190 TaxID=1747226 RepID=UPI00131D1301|nr:GNAT family N-acetyltransferase [Granulicella sp. S190]
MQAKDETNSRKDETNPSEIQIRPLQFGEDSTAFRTLNEEWITTHFNMEAIDLAVLSDPENMILRKGGQIFMVYREDVAVACVALIPMDNGVFELSKMAVSPHLRGLGIGRKLLDHAVTQARALGIKSLFLGSNSKLKDAVHLYESIGFRHVPPESMPDIHYARSNVFMELTL